MYVRTHSWMYIVQCTYFWYSHSVCTGKTCTDRPYLRLNIALQCNQMQNLPLKCAFVFMVVSTVYLCRLPLQQYGWSGSCRQTSIILESESIGKLVHERPDINYQWSIRRGGRGIEGLGFQNMNQQQVFFNIPGSKYNISVLSNLLTPKRLKIAWSDVENKCKTTRIWKRYGTGGKFATGVVDTGGATWLANICE